MKDQEFYNLVAAGLAFGVAVVFVAWAGLAIPANANPSSSSQQSSQPTNMYLTIQLNPMTGTPQYSPANFTVPAGEVTFTIIDYDMPAAFSGCACNVTGTVGGVEAVNGTTESLVPNTNVAHTFDVPALGVNVLSPGMSSVTFTLDLTQPGTYMWLCEMPCGAEGATGAPMGTPGFMMGSITVS